MIYGVPEDSTVLLADFSLEEAQEMSIPKDKIIFVGKMKDFRKFKYHGPDKEVFIRIRNQYFDFSYESMFVLVNEGFVELPNVRKLRE